MNKEKEIKGEAEREESAINYEESGTGIRQNLSLESKSLD
jgi:hypothetical protein